MSREVYDRLRKETWGDLQRLGPVHRHQRQALITLVTKLEVRTVLDVGCGSGENLAALVRTIPHLALSGVDVSPEALTLAARRAPGVRLRELDAQRDKLDERFDLVMALQVIKHLADDVATLRNMTAMADRWVLVTTMRGRMRPSELAIGHLRNYSNGELRRKAASAGLNVVDLFGWGFPFYSPLYRTVVEWLPGGPPQGPMRKGQRAVACLLYLLYCFRPALGRRPNNARAPGLPAADVLHAASRGVAPSWRDAREGFAGPLGADRAQPAAARDGAISVEPAVAQPAVFCSASGGQHGKGRVRRRRYRACPRSPGKWRTACAIVGGDWSALRLAPRMLCKRAEVHRISRLSPVQLRRLLLARQFGQKEVA